MEVLKTKLDRVYNTIIAHSKGNDPTRQVFPGQKNPEKIHSLAVSPEYAAIEEFTLQIAEQLPPTTCDSIIESDIGTLEQWGELLLKRTREFDETIEEYRQAILDALYPIAQGGNRNDIVEWSLEVPDVRMVYPYVGSRPVDEINIDDIEGRLDGGSVFVRSDNDQGIPDTAMLDAVRSKLIENGTISIFKLKVVPITHVLYDFKYTIKPAILGGGSSAGEAQSRCVELTYQILDRIEPYVLYYHDIRRDFIVTGQFFQQINKQLRLPPYEWILEDLIIERGIEEVSVEVLQGGQIPLIGNVNFL